VAVLPERILIVTGETSADSRPAQSDQLQVVQRTQSNNQDSVRVGSGATNYWQWIAAALFGVWIATLVFWFKSAKLKNPIQNIQPGAGNYSRKSLQQACRTNNPLGTRNELIAWARQNWPEKNITGLHQIKHLAGSTSFMDELGRLDEALFSPVEENWSGEALWNAFLIEQQRPATRSSERAAVIPPLYTH
jgi:hypothetical protein